MVNRQQRSSGLARVRCGLAAMLALAFLSSSAALADWNVLVGRDPNKGSPIGTLSFRPNVTDERVYVFVQNTGDEGEKVTVRLFKQDAPGVRQPLTEKSLFVPGKKTERVNFAKVAAAEPPPKDAKPAAPAFVPLSGPPFTLIVEVVRVAATGEETPLAKAQEIPIEVLGPHEHVRIVGQFEEEGKTLKLTATAREEFVDQTPSTLELVLDQVKGLIPGKKEGTYTGRLLKQKSQVELVARNLRFDGGAPKEGRVYVNVDGCPRAVGFNISFTADTNVLQQITAPEVRIPSGRLVSKPTGKMPLPLQVYNARERDDAVRIEVVVDRNKDGKETEDEVDRYRGARRQQVGVSVGDPAGGLLFRTGVQDWQIEVDTTGLYGSVDVTVRLMKDAEKLAETKALLLIDESKPEILELAPVEKVVFRGEPQIVRVRAKDDDTLIDRVLLFVGEPVEGKAGPEAPKDAEKGVLVPGQSDQWEAQLLMPDRRGKVTITAQVFNRAGLSEFQSVVVPLAERTAGADAAQAKKYKISGKVIEGERPQGDLEVVLKDDKGAVKATTKSSKDKKTVGTFTFENVAPGVYTVSSSKVGSNTKGEATATVEMADVTGVVIKLFR